MKAISSLHRSLLLVSLLGLVCGLVLSACEGTAFIDVSFDATEGVGNVVITGDQSQPDQSQGDGSGNVNMSQILLFGLVVALLLATVAIIISLARRPRPE